jgi:hypothetical protein
MSRSKTGAKCGEVLETGVACAFPAERCPLHAAEPEVEQAGLVDAAVGSAKGEAPDIRQLARMRSRR